jgi:hypothetical protein
MEQPPPRPAPDRAIARLCEGIDATRALPIVARKSRESHATPHGAGVEGKETVIGADEVPVAAGIQEGPDSGRIQAVVAAKGHGGLAIEPYQSFSGAEPDEPRRSLRTHRSWSRGRPSAVVKVRTGRRSADTGDAAARATTIVTAAVGKTPVKLRLEPTGSTTSEGSAPRGTGCLPATPHGAGQLPGAAKPASFCDAGVGR